jgi:hypothetical protein
LVTLANTPTLQPLAQRLYVSYRWIDIANHLLKNLVNLTSIWMEGKTNDSNMSQFFLSRQVRHVVVSDDSGLSDIEWVGLHNSWAHLETLTFDGSSPEFYHRSQSQPFASLRALEFTRTDVEIPSLPSILPNTLHSFKLHHATISGRGVVPFMLQYHSQSLQRLEVVACYGGVNTRAILRAMNSSTSLKYLKLHKNPPASFELTELPASLVEATVDLPSCLPEEVLALIKERGRSGGGELRLLSLGVGYHFDDLEWEQVILAAKGSGVAFSIRRLFIYPDSDT